MEAKDALEDVASEDLGRALTRLRYMLQAAHRSSIDVKNSYDFYVLAFKELSKDNRTDAFLYYDRAKYELTSAINDAKHNLRGLRIHSSRTLSFFFKLYGLYAVTYGILAAIIFGMLIYRYSDLEILGVPLWSSFFAGLGSSAQILTGVVDDLRREGIVVRYKRIWYTTIPLLSMIFGYMAYLLFSSGLIAFNVRSDETVFSTMLVCFLTGFMTNWLIDRLSSMSKNM